VEKNNDFYSTLRSILLDHLKLNKVSIPQPSDVNKEGAENNNDSDFTTCGNCDILSMPATGNVQYRITEVGNDFNDVVPPTLLFGAEPDNRIQNVLDNNMLNENKIIISSKRNKVFSSSDFDDRKDFFDEDLVNESNKRKHILNFLLKQIKLVPSLSLYASVISSKISGKNIIEGVISKKESLAPMSFVPLLPYVISIDDHKLINGAAIVTLDNSSFLEYSNSLSAFLSSAAEGINCVLSMSYFL
jgi:hypothetical protein